MKRLLLALLVAVLPLVLAGCSRDTRAETPKDTVIDTKTKGQEAPKPPDLPKPPGG